MRRIQLHLDEDLDDALGRQALQRGIPKAALIRELLRRALPVRQSPNDPSSRLVGIFEGERDESSSVDQVLYDR